MERFGDYIAIKALYGKESYNKKCELTNGTKEIDGKILRGSKKRRNEKINEKEELQEAFENYMNLKDKYDKDYVLRINLKDFFEI